MIKILFSMNNWWVYHSEGVSGPYRFYNQAVQASKEFERIDLAKGRKWKGVASND
jgi:hypothetical protein